MSSADVSQIEITMSLAAPNAMSSQQEPYRTVVLMLNDDDHLEHDSTTYEEAWYVPGRGTHTETIVVNARGELHAETRVRHDVGRPSDERVGEQMARLVALMPDLAKTLMTRLPGMAAPIMAAAQALDRIEREGES